MSVGTYNLLIRDQSYTILLSTQLNLFTIECTLLQQQITWTAKFTAQYIEDMTIKTGISQSYNRFILLLSDALHRTAESPLNESSELLLDILTVNDLQQIKRQKQGLSESTNINDNVNNNNKRYLILTLQSDSTPVHYPLPLKLSSNHSLHHRINSINAPTPTNTSLNRSVSFNNTALSQSAASCVSDKCIHALKLVSLQRDHSKLSVELEIVKSELNAVQHTSRDNSITKAPASHSRRGSKLVDQSLVDQLESHIWELQEHINQLNSKYNKRMNSANDEINILQSKLAKSTELEHEYRIKCRKLESDLKQLNQSNVYKRNSSRSSSVDNRQARGRSRPVSRSSSVTSLRNGSNTTSSMSRSSSVSSVRNVVNRLYPGGSSIRSRNSSPSPANHSTHQSNTSTRTRSASPSTFNSTGRSIRSTSSTRSFDATAYIRQKQEKEKNNLQRRQAERTPARVTPARETSRTRVDRDGNIVAVRHRSIDGSNQPAIKSTLNTRVNGRPSVSCSSTGYSDYDHMNVSTHSTLSQSSSVKYIEAQKHSAETQQEIDYLLRKLDIDQDNNNIHINQPRRVSEIDNRLSSLQSLLQHEKQALRQDS